MAIQGDQARTAHLLRRFGLGASEAEVDYFSRGGWQKAVERLLDYESIEEPIIFGEEYLKDQEGRIIPNPRLAQTACYAWLLTTTRPLQAKMTLFWHDHFATSSEKVSNGPAMYNHWSILRDQGLGNFEQLLLSISKDPAMLYWLDNIENLKGKPNENFAREIMELFTLGEGNYTEKDIQEVARSFTGWSYGVSVNGRTRPNRGEVPTPRHSYYFDFNNHDGGNKVVFNETGPWNGDDVIKLLCKMPRTAFYITEKIWSWFAYPQPDKSLVQKHADVFAKSNLSIRALVRSVMLDEDFYSDKAERKIIKNPIDFCIPTMRQLGAGAAMANALKNGDEIENRQLRGTMQIARIPVTATTTMGMELLRPPDVSGWPSMTQWITTSTMVERMKWSDSLFGRNFRGGAQLTIAAVAPVGATPTKVVENFLSILDSPLPDSKKTDLVNAATDVLGKGTVSARNAAEVAQKVARLLFSTPEFQFM